MGLRDVVYGVYERRLATELRAAGPGVLPRHVGVILDGNRGVVIINPDPEQLAEHREFEKKLIRLETELETLRELPAETHDGHQVSPLLEMPVKPLFDDFGPADAVHG